MRQIKNILFLVLLLLGVQAGAQPFNRLYPNESTNTFATGIIEVEDGFISCGQKLTYTDRPLTLRRINLAGDTLWERTYGNDLKIYYAMSLYRQDESIIVFGFEKDSAAVQDESNIFISKWSLDGNLTWYEEIPGSRLSNFTDFVPEKNKGFTILGNTNEFSPNIYADFYLVRTDSTGNVLWKNTYGNPGVDFANSITKTADGGYLLSGYTFTEPTQALPGNYDFLVIKADSLGNELWRKRMGTDYDDQGGYVMQLQDGCYLAATSFGDNQGNIFAKLIKLDPSGNMVWSSTYPSGNYSMFTSPPIENGDGTFTLTRSTKNNLGISVVEILKAAPTGSMIWQRQYAVRPDMTQYLYHFKSTTDGGYVFCGSGFDQGTPARQEGWIVKTDCFGCDGELCDYQDSTCDVYDCNLYPVNPAFSTTEINQQNEVTFINASANTTSRTWDFGDGSTSYYTGQQTHAYAHAGTYAVTLTVYHGVCSETSQQTIVVDNDFVGLDELANPLSFQIYPNPSRTFSTISFNETASGRLTVFSLAGQQAETLQVDNRKELTLPTDQLANGIYLVVFENSNGRNEQRKLVISK